jgi:hypothetical protein
MPALKDKKAPVPGHSTATTYHGRQTKTGNSSGFRFEGALFKSHPEFNGEVKAHVIAPGRMLVTAESTPHQRIDPVMESFLAFLGQNIAINPEKLRPLDGKLARRADQLTKGVVVDPEEDLGDRDIL